MNEISMCIICEETRPKRLRVVPFLDRKHALPVCASCARVGDQLLKEKVARQQHEDYQRRHGDYLARRRRRALVKSYQREARASSRRCSPWSEDSPVYP